MVRALLTLLLCQLAGAFVAGVLGAPIPGPVLGMAGLFGILAWRDGADPWLEATADTLLRHLGLLFVPAGVGIMTQLDRIRGQGAALGITLVVSTLAALLVAGWVLQRCLGASARDEEGGA